MVVINNINPTHSEIEVLDMVLCGKGIPAQSFRCARLYDHHPIVAVKQIYVFLMELRLHPILLLLSCPWS